MTQYRYLTWTHSKLQLFHILTTEGTWLTTHFTTAIWDTGVKRNFWLHAMCACTEWYSTYQIRWENWWLVLISGVSGYGRHGTCHGRHFDGGRKNVLAKIKIYMYSFLYLYFAPHARDVTKLDGARDNKQVWSLAPLCSNLRSFGSKCAALKKVLVTLLGLFGALRNNSRPHGDSAPGKFPPLPSFITPLPHAFINCKAASTSRPYLKH